MSQGMLEIRETAAVFSAVLLIAAPQAVKRRGHHQKGGLAEEQAPIFLCSFGGTWGTGFSLLAAGFAPFQPVFAQSCCYWGK